MVSSSYEILTGSYERFLFAHRFTLTDSSLTKRFTIDCHEQSIKAVSACGGFICTGSSDDRVRCFHYSKRGLADVGTLIGHKGTVTSVAFVDTDPESAPKRMISASEDGKLIVWQTYDWSLLRTLLAHRGGCAALAAHRSGKVALTCGREDKAVALWDLRKGRVAWKGKTRAQALDCFFCGLADEKYALLRSSGLEVLECETGERVGTFERDDQKDGTRVGYRKSLCASYSSAGDSCVYRVGYEGGDVCMFDWRSSSSSNSLSTKTRGIENAHENRVRAIKEIPGTSLFVTASSDGIIKIWDDRMISSSSSSSSSSNNNNKSEPVAEIKGGGRYTSLAVMDIDDALRRTKPSKPKELDVEDIEERLEQKKRDEKKANVEVQKKAEFGKKKKQKKTKADYDKMDSDSELEIIGNDDIYNNNNNNNNKDDDGSDDDDDDDDDDNDSEAIERARELYNKTKNPKHKQLKQGERSEKYDKNATTARKKANSSSSNKKKNEKKKGREQ